MNDKHFQMRLGCRYAGPDNTVLELDVEQLVDGEWRHFDLNTRSPGFEVYVYAIFTCQHTYFRLNCAERGVVLNSSSGAVHVVTDENWNLTRVEVQIDGVSELRTPSPGDIEYIIERMRQCPVSRNMRTGVDGQTRVAIVAA